MAQTPWSFAITFDEKKAEKNGYGLEALYSQVGKTVESFGNREVARGIWQAQESCDAVSAQCLALSALSKQQWFMGTVEAVTVCEDDGDEYDWLAVVRQIQPERICG